MADGYGNQRVIVLDATTGEFKRHWGGYGHAPVDGSDDTDTQFGRTVHGIALSVDGLLYVGDRDAKRFQVFHPNGTFVRERKLASVWDFSFSHDANQTYVYVVEGSTASSASWTAPR